MISGYRSNNGLGAVTIDPELMRLAGEQARVMAAHDKLDHDVGRPFQDRIRKSGFDAAVAVENISAGYHTMAEAFSGWRNSPPHRANMLNSNVTKMGIAAVYAPKSKYKVFWSLILAKPDEQARLNHIEHLLPVSAARLRRAAARRRRGIGRVRRRSAR